MPKKNVSRKVSSGTKKGSTKKGSTVKRSTVKRSTVKRSIVYGDISADVCCGEQAITVSDAKEMLGWKDVDEGEKNYSHEIYVLAKIKALCSNNVTNRPIYSAVVRTLEQEILRNRWRCNGEPIILGKTGLLLNGQHTLIALVLANLAYENEEHWREYWSCPPTIDKVVVRGISEDDDTVNTMDTCKPRSIADVIYRSPYFAALNAGGRKAASKMADYAVRLLWYRTGVGLNAFAPRKTHAETLDFIGRHPKILDAVRHVYEENQEKSLDQYTKGGYLSGLLYLMGCSATEPTEYRQAEHPNESSLDWSRWDAACDFIVLLASNARQVGDIKTAMASIIHEHGTITNAERWAVLNNAWLAYINEEPISLANLSLEYLETGDGLTRLAEHPSVGGIDLGDPSVADEVGIHTEDPTPDEIAQRAKELRNARERGQDKRQKKGRASKKHAPKAKQAPLKPSRVGDDWAIGDVAWVQDDDGEQYVATIVEGPWDCDDGERRVMVRTEDGQSWDVSCDNLGLTPSSAA